MAHVPALHARAELLGAFNLFREHACIRIKLLGFLGPPGCGYSSRCDLEIPGRAASASSFGGMSRPSAFAVFRLMTNSNMVGCMTGRSLSLALRGPELVR
jgi:hypothetical protein